MATDGKDPPRLTTRAERRRRWRQRFQRLARPAWFGTLRRTTPLSTSWGYDRGTPVDRYYIERFLFEHRADIRGRVVEIRSSEYVDRFGTGVEQRDVLDVDPTNPRATIVADLSTAEGVPDDSFDCFVLTQTLQFIPEPLQALGHVRRVLKPGGVLLASVPCISRIQPRYGLEQDYWRFTAVSCAWLFGQVFGVSHVEVRTYGNVLVALAFLAGVAHEELSPGELAANDPYFPLVATVRAVKA
jgi:SAM-dependent methyltransferase